MLSNTQMPNNISLTPAEDYDAMRSAGIQTIEQLGSDQWTDYNTSDPGITILEAVAYAITDLGYRTGFDVKDLLAPEEVDDHTWDEIFYTARQILPNSPVTINDYRKVILDIEGIRNAWLHPSKEYEVPVWVNYNFYEKRDEVDCDCAEPEKVFCLGQLDLQPADETKVSQWWAQQKEKVNKLISKMNETLAALETNRTKLAQDIENEIDPVAVEHLKKSLEEIIKKIQKQRQEKT
ncbi:MAG: hypothetical protein ABIN48_12560, partial [Ginsengibacter sp.]